MDGDVSMEQWKCLYDAARQFQQLGPWAWMSDADLFGVKPSSEGETGYCCIMGQLGEHFGMMMYLDGDGYAQYCRLQAGDEMSGREDVAFSQTGLMVSFEDRDYLSPQDLGIIHKLGLTFQGSNAWPMFRSHRPGYFPWYLEGPEAEFLLVCLRQALDVAVRVRESPGFLIPAQSGQVFVRSREERVAEEGWKDGFHRPDPPVRREVSITTTITKDLNAALQGKKISTDLVWEAGAWFIPNPVQDGDERPYFPQCMVMVDQKSFFVLDIEVASAPKRIMTLMRFLLRVLDKQEILPGKILVRDPELGVILDGLLAGRGIAVVSTDELPAADDVKQSMMNDMFGGGMSDK